MNDKMIPLVVLNPVNHPASSTKKIEKLSPLAAQYFFMVDITIVVDAV